MSEFVIERPMERSTGLDWLGVARPAAPRRCTLAFRVPVQDAARVRLRLGATQVFRVQRCLPHPVDKQVTLWIDFDDGLRERLMHLLMRCVPSGQFGRVDAAPVRVLTH